MKRCGPLLVFCCICRTTVIAASVSLLDRKTSQKKFSFVSKALDWKVCLSSWFSMTYPETLVFLCSKETRACEVGNSGGLKVSFWRLHLKFYLTPWIVQIKRNILGDTSCRIPAVCSLPHSQNYGTPLWAPHFWGANKYSERLLFPA